MHAFPPPRKALTTGIKLSVVMLVPLVVVTLVVGWQALLPALMGLLAAAVVPYCTLKQAMLFIIGLSVTGVAATMAYGNLIAVVAVVVVACLAAGYLGRLSAGVFGMAPIVAAVLSLEQPSLSPLQTGVVMLIAGAYVEIVILLLKLHLPTQPVPSIVAIRHGLVMAAACGVSAAVAVHYDWPHSYWLVMTLSIVLRPYASDSLTHNRQRIAGTLMGAVIAALLSPLPHSWQLVFAGICMALMFTYMTLHDYTVQVTFMTPMVIFLVSSGTMSNTLSMDGLRIVYTLAGCAIGGALALLLARQQSDDASTDAGAAKAA